MTSKVAKVVLIVLTCTSLSLPPTIAEAGMRTGTWRNGMIAGPYGIGYYGGYRPAVLGGYHGGYRPLYDGYRPAYYGYGYRPYYRRHNDGGAVAAGLIGGLAL